MVVCYKLELNVAESGLMGIRMQGSECAFLYERERESERVGENLRENMRPGRACFLRGVCFKALVVVSMRHSLLLHFPLQLQPSRVSHF